jgi:hypothetical protein
VKPLYDLQQPTATSFSNSPLSTFLLELETVIMMLQESASLNLNLETLVFVKFYHSLLSLFDVLVVVVLVLLMVAAQEIFYH